MGDRKNTESQSYSNAPDLSLVVPCYNEVDVIRNTAMRLIREFEQRDINLELILVDNGSMDDTGEIIDRMVLEGMPIVKATVEVNEGYGNGILQGLKYCQGDYVGFICADGQVEAHDVVKVYEIAANAKSPYLVKVRRRFRMDGLVRKIVSINFNLLITVLFGGLGSIDINGNPKIFPSSFLKPMDLQSRDWFLDAEVMIKAKRLGLKVFELNVIAQMREGGKSNVRTSTVKEFINNLVKYRFGLQGMKNEIVGQADDNKIVTDQGE
jgi:glycosyltransferase involved in cell wall biosynthesis